MEIELDLLVFTYEVHESGRCAFIMHKEWQPTKTYSISEQNQTLYNTNLFTISKDKES